MNIESILAELRSERDRLNEAIAALEGVSGNHAGRSRRGRPAGRHMSAAARARIGAAMRARWAARKGGSKPAPKPAAKKSRRGGMSAINRKRQSQRMRQYWAARRKKQAASA